MKETCETTMWKLVGEGKSCVAVVDSSHAISPPSHLLICKKVVGNSYKCIEHNKDLNKDVFLVKHFMRNWFGSRYVSDIFHTITLSDDITVEIIKSVSNLRSSYRQEEMPDLQIYSTVIVMRNFNTLYKTISSSFDSLIISQNNLSIEIKVKCGLKCRSPFVLKSRTVKLFRSRFWVMQSFKSKARKDFNSVSCYDPSMLCSRDMVKVKNELVQLLKQPQNNFRVTYSEKKIFGDNLNSPEVLEKALFASLNDDDITTLDNSFPLSTNFFLHAWSSIICNEQLVENLQIMQALDLIDIDGAALIYDKLVDLIGSRNEVDDLLSNAMLLTEEASKQLLEMGVVLLAINAEASISIDDLHHPVVRSLARLQLREDMSAEDVIVCQNEALRILESISIDDGVMLLKMWLLSLVARDASIIITIKVAYRNIKNISLLGQYHDAFFTNVTDKPAHGKTQTDECCGILLPLSNDENQVNNFDSLASSLVFFYNIGITDIGMKPVQKCWNKSLEEDAVLQACSDYLNYTR